MSRPLSAAADASLAPVRAALLADANAHAEVVLRRASQRREEMLANARRTAADLLAGARAEGAAEASAAVAALTARSGRDARLTVLAAQRALYDELRQRCRAAAADLTEAPDYAALRDRLAAQARAELGPDAVVTDSPDGGVVGTAGSRRVDLSMPALADGALDRLAGEVAMLWTL
ncbi:MAG TPA: hypothetical protein VFT31_08395 [Kribbella sp.]|nr:hypothetical protein [Kribbella sp.]